MYTISSFSPDTTLQPLSVNTITKSLSSPSSRKIGTVKLLILAIVLPIMILTIINPMWICIFMKYPHIHRYTLNKTPVNVEVPHGGNRHVSQDNVHNDNVVAHVKPQTHTNTKSFKGGIKITQETFDVIVASKDGRRVQELETTITVIENISPESKNKHHRVQHGTNKKEATDVKTHAQLNKPSVASEAKNNNESIIDRIRERLFRNRNSCAYLALSVILLCVVTIGGVICLSGDSKKEYESVSNDEQPTNDHYVRIDDDDKINVENEKLLNENDITENNTDVCVTECTQVQIISFNDSHFNDDNLSTHTPLPPPYSSNTTSITSITSITSPENIQQSTDEN